MQRRGEGTASGARAGIPGSEHAQGDRRERATTARNPRAICYLLHHSMQRGRAWAVAWRRHGERGASRNTGL